MLEEFVAASEYENAGERVVAGPAHHAGVERHLPRVALRRREHRRRRTRLLRRQLRDWKGSVAIETMNERGLTVYAQLCAATLAHAHARSGDRIAIASYLGGGGRLRPGAACLLRSLRRAERARLRRPRRRRAGRARGGGGRGLSAARRRRLPLQSRRALRPRHLGDRHPGGRAHAPLRRQGRAVRGAAARIERARGEGRRRRPGSARNPRSEGRAEAGSPVHKVAGGTAGAGRGEPPKPTSSRRTPERG